MPTDRPADAEWTLLHGGALGDLVLTVQLALSFADVSPRSRIRLVARTGLDIPATCTPTIVREAGEGIGLHWLHSDSTAPPPERVRQLFQGRRIVSAYGDPTSRMHARLRELEPAALFSFDPVARLGDARHITGQWHGALHAQGLQFSAAPQTLRVPDALRTTARGRLAELGCAAPCFIMHAGSGSPRKCWPIASFIDVARGLRETGATVLGLLGPAEVERLSPGDTAALRAATDVLVSAPDSATLALLMAAARGYIGNDSGPTHLAALLGTPVVALFGPTAPDVWRPLGRAVRVLSRVDDEQRADWGIACDRVIDAVAELSAQT